MARAQVMVGDSDAAREYAQRALELIRQGKGPAGLEKELDEILK